MDDDWVRPGPSRRQLRADLLLAVSLAAVSAVTVVLGSRVGLSDPEHLAPVWLWVVGLGLVTLPLAWRRRYPASVLGVVAIGFFVCGQFGVPETLICNIALFVAIYTVGAWSKKRLAANAVRGVTVIAMAVWLGVSLVVSASDPDSFGGLSRVGVFSALASWVALQLIINLFYFAGAIFFGEHAWRAARTVAVLKATGLELDRERELSVAQAVALDRMGIARELHDVVAHHVSVMGIQAGAARRVLDSDPEKARSALALIEDSAGSAVDELRSLLVTLRSGDEQASSSTVGLAQLGQLVETSKAAGTETTLLVLGRRHGLPALVDVALYRFCQEALTNVRKHAGAGARAEVRLRFLSSQVELEVSDNGLGGSSKLVTGNGLRGMRERIGTVGGTVHVQRREAGGFLVRAAVPLARRSVAEADRREGEELD